ncbi:MAG: HesA/MoeB/ThiF family protein [Peptococcaceae bacterium]|nr:HesA/MoeB/ThiF family protein [Peptococcaceae bacterium]
MERYRRQIILPGWGTEGQEKLRRDRVLVVGAGGLGSINLYYLTGAGVGTIGIVDDDTVTLSNLHRQILYTTDDLGRPKAECAAQKLKRLNPEVVFEAYPISLKNDTADELFKNYDVIVDGLDNLAARNVLNATCLRLNKPWVHGAVSEFYGVVTTFVPHQGPCWRCLYRNITGNEKRKEEFPILGPVPGVIGSIQAGEVLKLLTGLGSKLVGRMLVWQALQGRWSEFSFTRDPYCPACSSR